MQTLGVNNSRIPTIKNVTFLWYYFYTNFNLWRDFQNCISEPLNVFTISFKFSEGFNKNWFIIIVKVTHLHGKVFITFHRIKWKNLAATENTIPRIIGILKEFLANIIKVKAINVNPIVTKVILNSLMIINNIFSTDFARKVY